nr:sodium/hydrogen exchanger 3 [Quercus suber]
MGSSFVSSFQAKKKQFFKNFTTILLFEVVGTVISFCLISLGAYLLFKRIGVTSLDIQDYLAVGAILSATDSVCTLQVLNQDETPLLYSIVFGEGVVNDATSIALFNAVQSLDVSNIDLLTALKLLGTFLYLFFTSTALGIAVFGSITKPLIEAVLLRNVKPAHSEATDIPSQDDLQILFLEIGDPSDQGGSNEPARRKGSLSLLISNPTSIVHYFWRKFDDKFTRPVFGGQGFVPFVPSSPTGAVDP